MLVDGLELVGKVVQGDQRGRTIGFPTANLAPEPKADLPPVGVYAAIADGRPAAVNVGVRPTFSGASPAVVIEIHLIDFQGDLYGREMRVRFLRRLRDERHFESVPDLVAQLERDVATVREVVRDLDELACFGAGSAVPNS